MNSGENNSDNDKIVKKVKKEHFPLKNVKFKQEQQDVFE
jgi:hypothetical protein